MANPIASVVGNQAPSTRLDDLKVREGMSYTPDQARHVDHYSDTFKQLGNIAQWARGKVKEHLEDEEDQSDIILNKYTPEQRKLLHEHGILHTQYNKKTVQSLYHKIGLTAAFEADKRIKELVENGTIKDREQLGEVLKEIREDSLKTYADTNGLDVSNEAYQLGFSKDITQRNIALYDGLSGKVSDRLDAQIEVNNVNTLQRLFSDMSLVNSETFPELVTQYFDKQQETEAIPNPKMAGRIGRKSLSTLVDHDRGLEILLKLQDQEVNLDGVKRTWKQHFGEDHWDNLLAKARVKLEERSTGYMSELAVALTALNGKSSDEAKAFIEQQESKVNEMFPEEHGNRFRSMLTNAKQNLQARLDREAKEQAVEADKLQEKQNKFLQYNEVLEKRKAGEIVSLDAFGFKKEETAEFAQMITKNIENSNLSLEEKNKLHVENILADAKDGAFRNQFDSIISTASSELESAVIAGEWNEDNMKNFERLKGLYNQNPSLISILSPENASVMAKLDIMQKYNVPPEKLLDQMRLNKTRSPEDKAIRDRAWLEKKFNSSNPNFANLSYEGDLVARAYYDSALAITGNESVALDETEKFMDKTTVNPQKDTNSHTDDVYGSIPKSQLMVTDNPESWQSGYDLVLKGVTALKEKYPDELLNVRSTPKGILVQMSDGSDPYLWTPELLQKVYQEQLQQDIEKSTKDREDKLEAGFKQKTMKAKNTKELIESLGSDRVTSNLPDSEDYGR